MIFLTCLFLFLATIAAVQKKTDSQPSDIKVVRLPVLVTDSEYNEIKNLTASDFTVIDEGQRQKILSLSAEERPLKYGILIETSWTIRGWLPVVKATVNQLVNGNQPGDQAFVMRFSNEKTELVQDWTANASTVIDSISGLMTHGGNDFFEGMYRAIDYIDKIDNADDKARPHKALIVFTTGDDFGSRHSSSAVVKRLHELDLQVFIFCFPLRPSPFVIGHNYATTGVTIIKSFANESGGLAFLPQTPEESVQIGTELTSLIRHQYVLTYSPSKLLGKGKFHKVSVQVGKQTHNGPIVRTRSGYTEINP